MASQYEIDWRTEKLAKAGAGVQVSKQIIGVAKAGFVFQGGTDTNIMPWSGDQGSSVGMVMGNEAAAVRLYVYVLSNDLGSQSQVRLRKNETNTSLVVNIPAGQTGVFSTSGYVYFAPLDRIDFHLVTGGTSSQAIDIPSITLVLELT